MSPHDTDLEKQLRHALRPVDPPEGFTERVMAAIERERAPGGAQERAPEQAQTQKQEHAWARPQAPVQSSGLLRNHPIRRIWASSGADTPARWSGPEIRHIWRWHAVWLPTAASVALAITVGAGWIWHQQAQASRARAAREQVYRALRISSETLNAALDVAIDPNRPS